MISYYLGLLDDRERIDAMARVIRATVKPDDVVVDLGCGIGSYSIFAARAGARRVFAVESSPAIEYAREMAKRNQVEIEFFNADARDVELPERATVLIYEDYPTGLFAGPSGAVLEDVIRRWMRPGFRTIPQRARLYAAPLSSKEVRQAIDPFHAEEHALDLSSLLEASLNSPHTSSGLDPEEAQLLSPAQLLVEQALDTPFPSHWKQTSSFELDASANLDGICIWHDLVLSDAEVYSNTPTQPAATWGQIVFPVPRPWPVASGDRLTLELEFDALFGRGLWKWSVTWTRADGSDSRSFSGNSFAGSPVATSGLRAIPVDQKLQLTESAKIESLVLSLVDGERTLPQVAQEVRTRLGLSNQGEALQLVMKALERKKLRE